MFRRKEYKLIWIPLLLFSFIFRLPPSAASSKPDDLADTVKLYQAMLDINYPFTVMCMAAHPDDEDSEALAYYRMKYGARTVIVTSTRGEGGQNSQGPELNEELGVLRVGELAAAARRIDAI